VDVTKVLLVNDDESALVAMVDVLERSGYAVTCATNLTETLETICSTSYDALLTNFHLSRARDGLMIVNALRSVNPSAVILLLSAFPQLETAAQAILLQTDEILARPADNGSLIDVLRHRLAIRPVRNREIESVSAVLDHTEVGSLGHDPCISHYRNQLRSGCSLSCRYGNRRCCRQPRHRRSHAA